MTLDRLWAPWRMPFIKGAHATAGCLFCRVVAASGDRAHGVIARRPHGLLMLNRFPYAPAHLMVAVARHVGSFGGLNPEEREDFLALTALGEKLLRAEYRPHGINAGANLGRVAGAGFPGHLHLHLVPRWNGDTNFMATTAGTRVLPESLGETWRRLRRARERLAGRRASSKRTRGAAGRPPAARRRG